MIYDSTVAARVQAEWKLTDSVAATWRYKGIIPDELALHKNLEAGDRLRWYGRFLALVGDGWINAEYVCRHYGWVKTRISKILTFLRNSDTYQARALYGEEVDKLKDEFLLYLVRSVPSLVRRMQRTPTDQMISAAVQADLLELLRHPFLNHARVRPGLDATHAKRLRDIIAGRAKPFRHLSDKPALLAVMAELEALEALLDIEPGVATPGLDEPTHNSDTPDSVT